ncbi:hypothetical protein KC330_g8887 [Hortaea werneckii]|nr:hypothetical protein KC330_g8887 [Hortaea werneckii]
MLTITFLPLLLQEYHDPQRTYTSVAQTLSAYPTLSPRTEVFTHETGRSALLLVLSGTLPTHFRGAEYRFPIKIWFPHTYPHEAPMVFVTPGGGMAIRPGQHVGTDGRVYHPYLRDWRGMGAGGWEDGGMGGSKLGEFLRVLTGVFEREPPVVSRVQSQQPPAQGNHVSGMTSSPRPVPSSASPLPPQLPPKQTHGSVYESQQRQAPPPVEMSATTNSPPPPPKPPKPGQEPVFPERSTSRNLARDGPPLPPLPHERVGSAQYAASPPPSTPMYTNRTGSVSRPPPAPLSQGMSGYEATPGQHVPPATPLAHQQFQQVRAAAAGREGSPDSAMMPNGQGYDQRYSQHFMPGMQGNSQQHPGGARASFQHHPNHHSHQQQVPPQQPYHQQGQINSPSYQQYPPNQLHPQYHQQQPQQPLPPNQIPPTPHPTKPPPPPDLLTTDPFEISLPTDPTTTNPASSAPPIPPNPEKEHLLSALASTLATQTQSKVSQNLQAVAPLQAQNSALRAAIGRLEKEVQGLEEWGRVLDSNERILRRGIGECEAVVAGRYRSTSSNSGQQDGAGGTTHPPIDDILVPPTLVANQLWTLCAEEASCREAMYVLQQAVDRGRVGGRDFVRLMRGLGREAFFKKALARKCARGLGLDDGVGVAAGKG